MTKIDLLNSLKAFTEKATSEILLPVRHQKEDGATPPADRQISVHLMRLPDSTAASKKAPYCLHQVITGKDSQAAGDKPQSIATVRSIFCVYNENEELGALSLLEVIERIRIELLRQVVLSKRFQLDLTTGAEYFIYPDDTAPYYAGEMITTWKLPSIEREVFPDGRNRNN